MIRIITDSACDLPAELAARYGILVMPMQISIGEDTYKDQVELSTEEFYRRLLAGDEFPRTAYPPLALYQQALDAELAAGNSVVIITIARALSGCYDALRAMLPDYPADRVALFDSQSATLGEGAVVLEAARRAEAGCGFDELRAGLPAIIERSRGYGAINNLVYLAKGGRINGTLATVATALNIKPIINVCADGSLEVAQKVRGMAKALAWLAANIKRDGRDFSKGTLFVSYIVQEESARRLLEQLQDELELGEVIFSQIGPTVGTHLGPGCVALFYLKP